MVRKPGQRITLKAIAQHLGVSQGTVSLALNNGAGVNADTRRRVKEYAREVGYQPNAAARAIITGETRLIAVLLLRLTDSFFEEIVQGIENVADRSGYDVIVNSVSAVGGQATNGELIERLVGRNIDGLIGAAPCVTEATAQRLQDVGIPVLLMRPEITGPLPCLAVDNRLGGLQAAEHLLSLGHRHLIFLGGSDRYSDLRAEGAQAALQAAGACLERLFVPTGLDMQAAFRCIKARLRQDRDFTAVFCSDDLLALGVCNALREEGIAVPGQVSVVGYDDLHWTRWLHPALTTIHQPQGAQGEAAMEMLIEMMQGRDVQSRLFAPRLIARDSSGPAPYRSS
jgi:DNA-binding LacI/PurR family transcriptional regulator